MNISDVATPRKPFVVRTISTAAPQAFFAIFNMEDVPLLRRLLAPLQLPQRRRPELPLPERLKEETSQVYFSPIYSQFK